MSKNKLILALLLLLALPARALGDDIIDDTLVVPETANYKTQTIEYGDYTKESSGSGTQVFIVNQNLSLQEGTAHLKGFNCTRNQEVKAGDVLVTYEKDGSRAELERMKLALKRAQEGFAQGKKTRTENIRKLKADLTGLTDEYDVKLKQIEIQKAQLDYDRYVYETEHSVSSQTKDIDKLTAFYADTQIVAPFDGIVTDLATKNPGDTIYAGETMVVLQAQDRYVISVDNSTNNFRYGMHVNVALGPRNKKTNMDGQIIASGNILPNENKIAYALIELNGTPEKNGLKNISISGNSIELSHVLLISRGAITFDEGKNFVSILDGDMVQKRIITSGQNSTGNTWIVQGLSEGQKVIID